MYYSFEDYPAVDLSCFKDGLSNFQYTQKDNADYYCSGNLNNLKCTYSERGISVRGSLCKYNYGYNFNTLSKRETSNTIGRLTDQLGFDIYRAQPSPVQKLNGSRRNTLVRKLAKASMRRVEYDRNDLIIK